MTGKGMTYEGVGVNYEEMDPYKVACTKAGLMTSRNLSRFHFNEMESSRGESAYVMRMPPGSPFDYLAHVVEGLGTKNKVAENMIEIAAKMARKPEYMDYPIFGKVAICTVAMIVNDLITVGALPLSVGQYLAVGDSAWFKNEGRWRHLVSCWATACDQAGCAWGGGETPTLKGIIEPSTIDLAGAAVGIISKEEYYLHGGRVRPGDLIMLIGSSGIHANGLTMARAIAEKLTDGFFTLMPSGTPYGWALLDPTIIYVKLIEACQNEGVDLHYAVNITGHGWRKLMRSQEKLEYLIEIIPEAPEVFTFMQEYGPISDYEAYGNFNMGAGFALYVPPSEESLVLDIAESLNYQAMTAGYVKASKERKVTILPKHLVYHEKELKVR